MAKRKAKIDQAEIVRSFGLRLREVRQSRGMTQADLAHKALVAVSYIWKLESGGAAPGIDLVERFAVALGVEITELLPSSGAMEPLTVLQDQAKILFESIMKSKNKECLLVLNPLMACLVENLRRRG